MELIKQCRSDLFYTRPIDASLTSDLAYFPGKRLIHNMDLDATENKDATEGVSNV